MVVLNGITQCKKETLHGYINHFAKVAIAIGRLRWKFKMLDFLERLKEGLSVAIETRCKEAHNLNDLLIRTQTYINYEEKLLGMETNRMPRNIGFCRPLKK